VAKPRTAEAEAQRGGQRQDNGSVVSLWSGGIRPGAEQRLNRHVMRAAERPCGTCSGGQKAIEKSFTDQRTDKIAGASGNGIIEPMAEATAKGKGRPMPHLR